MVMVKYNGTALYKIGGYQKIEKYAFLPGKTVEILDEDFYRLMVSKPFAYRVNNNILVVPRDFPIVRPLQLKEVQEKAEHEKEEETSLSQNVASLKSTLRLIQETKDEEFLNQVLESDSRDRVKEAVKKRLFELEQK